MASELFKKDRIEKFIVVGLWNNEQTRHSGCFPQQPFEDMSQSEKDIVVAQLQDAGNTNKIFNPQSDDYLKFIVKELKLYIDDNYSVYIGTFRSNQSVEL